MLKTFPPVREQKLFSGIHAVKGLSMVGTTGKVTTYLYKKALKGK